MELDKPVADSAAAGVKRNDRSSPTGSSVLVNGGPQEYVIIVNPFDSDDIAGSNELCRGE